VFKKKKDAMKKKRKRAPKWEDRERRKNGREENPESSLANWHFLLLRLYYPIFPNFFAFE